MWDPELNGLVWNISNLIPTTVTKILCFLITREQPSLIMLVGGQLGGHFNKLPNTLGFKVTTSNKPTDGFANGVTILWQEDAISF